jgi:hypothetical protein
VPETAAEDGWSEFAVAAELLEVVFVSVSSATARALGERA